MTSSQNEDALYRRFEDYDFDKDAEFTTVFNRLLSRLDLGGPSSRDDLVLKAKVFYFSRTQEPVSLLGLKAWLASRSDSTAAAELASSHLVATPPPSLPSSSFSSSRSEAVLAGAAPTSSSYPSSHPAVPPAARAEPPPPLPFQKLASLIASGRVDEIPVMDIEEKVVEEPKDVEILQPRKKPWERD